MNPHLSRLSLPVLTALMLATGGIAFTSPDRALAGQHIEKDSPVSLSAPWTNGDSWKLSGSFYDEGAHKDYNNDFYATDWNKVGTSCDGDNGQSILAPAAGTVITARNDIGTDGAGRVVRIRLDADPSIEVHFYHLEALHVNLNEHVDRSKVLGTVGRTGLPANDCNYGSHLHMGVRQKIGGVLYSIRPGPLDGQAVSDDVTITSRNGGGDPGCTSNTPPTLNSPGNGHTVDKGQNISFSWSSVSGCTRYRFEAWNTTGSGSHHTEVNGTSLNFAPQNAGSWKWQVAVVKDGGANGPFPPTNSFTVREGSTTSCSPNADQVALFAQEGYGAPCVLLGEGTHTSFGSVGNSNTRSIRVGAYMKVTLCDHGSIICNTFDGDDSNLMDNGIAQRTESAKVEWRFGPAGKPHTPNPANNAQLTYTTQVTLSVQGDGPEFQFELWTQNNTLIKNQSWSSSRSMTVTGLTPGVYHWRAEARNPRGPSGWTDWYFTIAPQNRPPVANAGSDQSVTDANGNGSESVTLNGSASSDPDGDALTYAWSEGSNSLATGAQPPVTLSVGVHTITLRVTDTKGASATDTVKVTVNEPASGTPVTLKLEVGIYDLTDPYPGFVAPSAYSPDHVDRELSVQVTDGSDQVVRDLNVTARFSASKQAFTADVVVNLEPGSYRVKVKLSNTLRRLQAGFFTVGSTATSITVPRIVTIVGDVDGNNQANIIDYNRLMGCYSDFEPPKSCSSSDQPGPSRQPTVDLNDDGFVNQFDYNLMLRVFNFQLGD